MRSGHSIRRTSLAIIVIQALSLTSSLAATIVVDNGSDSAVGCTLRSAIVSINTAQNNGECRAVGEFGENDVIDFDVTSVGGLTSSLDITNDVSINPFRGPISIGSAGNGSVFNIQGSTVFFENVIISGGSAGLDGGGIFARDSIITLSNSTVMGNSAGDDGGGIFVRDSSLSLNNSTVSGNSASTNGAGDDGGGIYARASSVSLNKSTVSLNDANDEGGGIFVTSSTISLANSTISGNSAKDEGGGIIIKFNSNASIISSTFSNNTADRTAGGISIASGTASLSNSLVAGNRTGEGVLAVSELSVSAASALNLLGRNLFGDDSKTSQEALNFVPTENVILATSDARQSTPLTEIVSPLANNEGSTLTHALAEGSPAINSASISVCAATPTNNRDQRNFVRLDSCDIGAFEFGAAPFAFKPAVIVPPIMLLLNDDHEN